MSSGRTPLIAGNWKMNLTRAQTSRLLDELGPAVADAQGVSVGICPSYTSLFAALDHAQRPERLLVFAQNMHQELEGAYTGEVSVLMLEDAGVDGVVLGHSERRELFGETDAALRVKVPHALEGGLTVILCVGETDSERERGETERKLRLQVQEGLADVDDARLGDVVVAYEPIWAIGTGKVATPEQAQEAVSFIRALVADRSAEQARRTRILYGGSVNADNAAELLALPDVDGALVGGASLKADSFAAIVAAAGR